MSHLTVSQLERNIKFIKKNSNLKICIDTEGAQIRTKIKTKPIKIKKNKKFFILRDPKNFALYPEYIFDMLKKGDVLDIGFSNLRAKVYSKTKIKSVLLVYQLGYLKITRVFT